MFEQLNCGVREVNGEWGGGLFLRSSVPLFCYSKEAREVLAKNGQYLKVRTKHDDSSFARFKRKPAFVLSKYRVPESPEISTKRVGCFSCVATAALVETTKNSREPLPIAH
ncbi:MAG: hypothetical protein WKF89_04165 [Chitinophagaceae bacterium]